MPQAIRQTHYIMTEVLRVASGRPGSESHLCHLLAVEHWKNHFTSLIFSVYTMETIVTHA